MSKINDLLTCEKKYDIILADPPWSFKTYSDKGKGRSAENHYKTMTMQDIRNLPVKQLSADNSVLFLWVCWPSLLEALKVFDSWGFVYKTCAFNWIKANKKAELKALNVNTDIKMGGGYYTRSNSEVCLLGTKGKILSRVNKGVKQPIISNIREHSRKPEELYERIDRLYGTSYNRLELFGRQEREFWDVWGNETEKFNNGS